MENKNLIIGLFLVIILVGIFLAIKIVPEPEEFEETNITQEEFFLSEQYKSLMSISNQNCFNQSGYCVYDDLPDYLLYSSPMENIPQEFFIEYENLGNYFIRNTSEGKSIDEAFGLDSSKNVCSHGETILKIKYFYSLCEGMEGMMGCGYSRNVLVCGDKYFIEEYSDSTGPAWYGPFEFEKRLY